MKASACSACRLAENDHCGCAADPLCSRLKKKVHPRGPLISDALLTILVPGRVVPELYLNVNGVPNPAVSLNVSTNGIQNQSLAKPKDQYFYLPQEGVRVLPFHAPPVNFPTDWAWISGTWKIHFLLTSLRKGRNRVLYCQLFSGPKFCLSFNDPPAVS